MNGSRAFRVAATSARVLTGAVVAAACVVGVVVGVSAPWPTVTHEPAQVEVTPLPGDTVLVCNGDFRAIGRDSSNSQQMVSAASPQITADGSTGTPESSSLSTGELDAAGELRRLTGTVDGRTAPLLGATESVSLAENDLFGFAAAPCRPASQESWLVGGSVATGTEDLVILTNPGAVASTVTLTVFGTVRASSTTIVPAGAQTALPLSSIAAGSEAPIVKVAATGAPVRAVLQSSLTRTLDPAGVDLQDAIPGAQQQPVIPGVQVLEANSDGSEQAVLRLMSPEVDALAVVTTKKLGSSGSAAELEVPLTADVPTEVSLSAVSAGTYDVRIEADAPVLAAVRQQDGAGPQTDFAWATPAPEFDDRVLVAVPEGPAAQLILVNDEDADVAVQLERLDGAEPEEVTVPAGSSVSVEVAARTVYSVSPSGPVHASVSMTAPGALAV